ncbi:unnamed protein product [Adineta steineri]|uniref:Hexosyltransferase n=1 Tax=Adineta steineri TaxID=433720 RepID=A0A813TNW9_9BILA|nr:unnamed protein product [Adineta steineri]
MGNLNSFHNRIMKEKTDQYTDYSNQQVQRMTSLDYLKIIAIIILLIGSVILQQYQPSSATTTTTTEVIISHNKNTGNLTGKLKNTGNQDANDNPNGFHPFYQVHGRIQFKNPPKFNPCHEIDPSKTLLLAILSRASNAHIREAIRQTWGAHKTYNNIDIRTTFIVAVDDTMIQQIELEQAIYHDVIQVNLPENYAVVSYKELAALCWSRYFCSDIKYIFKADEDIHLNTPLLTSLVNGFMKNESLADIPMIFGWFRYKSRVDRTGRYLVTEEEYPGFYYPPFTFGIGYLLTKTGRDNLCVSALRPHPVTRVGDAYITGILRDHAMVRYARFGDVHFIYSYTLNGPRCQEYFIHDPKLLICMSSLHSGTSDTADEYVNVWNAIHEDNNDGLDDQE